jgi:universal stress protein A
MSDFDSPVSEQAIQALQELAAHMNIPTANIPIGYGAVIGRILPLADDLNLELIIVASHGGHGLRRLMGTCANAIIHGGLGDLPVL